MHWGTLKFSLFVTCNFLHAGSSRAVSDESPVPGSRGHQERSSGSQFPVLVTVLSAVAVVILIGVVGIGIAAVVIVRRRGKSTSEGV